MDAVLSFLVEAYWPRTSVAHLDDAIRRLDRAFDEIGPAGHVWRTLSLTVVLADEAAYWVVEAASADLIARAFERAGLQVERVTPAMQLRSAQDARGSAGRSDVAIGIDMREPGNARVAPSAPRRKP